MKYRIAWKSKLTGKEGHGSYVYTEQECQEAIEKLNEEWKYINHWIEGETDDD